MKNLLLIILLITGTGQVLFAQIQTENISTSESLFNFPKPGTLYDNFVFYLPKGNRMTLEMSSISQLKKLPNLDSLAKKVYEDLQVFKDPLSKELTSKRIDYVVLKEGNKIRITEHKPTADYYTFKENEPVQMKVDQDTVRIKFYFKGEGTYTGTVLIPCFVTFIVNNISDIKNFPDNTLSNSLNNLLLKDLEQQFKADKPKWESGRYFVSYYVEKNERIFPKKLKYLVWGRNSGIDPYVQLGIQNVRGSWVPSTGIGFSFFQTNTRSVEKKSYSFFLEPYFFFSRDANNNSIVDRNDFMSFKFHKEFKNFRNNGIGLIYSNASIGYLIKRNGNWFEKNTVKFSLPGLQSKNIILEPEFYFNDFFKHFSPSLKLTLFFE